MMLRVTKQRPCPICGRPSWCGVSDNGLYAVCMRAEGGGRKSKNGGRVFYVGENRRPVDVRFAVRPESAPKRTHEEWSRLLAPMQRYAETIWMRDRIPEVFGLPFVSLRHLQIGANSDGTKFFFPMRAQLSEIVGVRTRSNGEKKAISGSRSGIFVPVTSPHLGRGSFLTICEGPTDTAAAVTLGLDAIGRPDCRSCVNIVLDYIRFNRYKRVAIVADNDKPGIVGAAILKDEIGAMAKTVIMVPREAKDLRERYHAGLGPGEFVFAVYRALSAAPATHEV